jgi:hypothetical protein
MIMRKILLLTVLIIGNYLPTFSQLDNRSQNNRLQVDTTFSNLSLKNNLKTPKLVNPFDSGWFSNNSRNNIKLIYPGLTDINSKSGQDQIANFNKPSTYDNMPCVKPQGFYPMPIVKPDSTVRYTLLIKKY